MKRYHFRLDTLLELRKRREDEIKQQLGKKNREILAVRKELSAINLELKSLQDSEKKTRNTVKSALLLRYSVTYRFKLKEDIVKKTRLIDELSVQAEGIREKLVRAKQQRRAIEIVKEKKLAEWKKEYSLREQKFIDDISQQGFIRKTALEKERTGVR
jgi:flagellar protein FliJ